MGARVIAILICVTAGLIGETAPHFAGKWELVINESDLGNLPKPARMTVESTVQGDLMHAVQNTYTEQGDHTTEFDWYLDGKRHSTDKPVPGWSLTHWQGNTLVNERESNDGAYKETIRVTLSPDEKTATEYIQTRNPNGSNRERLVWKKAQ